MRGPVDWTLDRLFDGRPGSRRLYNVVADFIESLGDVTVEVMKTQVSFGSDRKFAWVWLPQIWIRKQPENSIVLTFSSNQRIEDPHVKQSVEPRPGRWANHAVIEDEREFDDVVKGWLVEAFVRSRDEGSCARSKRTK